MSVEPRQAASLILLREAAEGAEVLLVQRNPEQRFMGGAWVFPGGAVDAVEADIARLAGSARMALKSTTSLATVAVDVLDRLIDTSTARAS